jgi:hypothetical protein
MPKVADYKTIFNGTWNLSPSSASSSRKDFLFSMPAGFDSQSRCILAFEFENYTDQPSGAVSLVVVVNGEFDPNPDAGHYPLVVPEESLVWRFHPIRSSQRSAAHAIVPAGLLKSSADDQNHCFFYAGGSGGVVAIRDVYILCQVSI